MYRYAAPVAAVLLTGLALTGCKSSVSASAPGTPSAPISPGAPVAANSATATASAPAATSTSATPVPSFSIPGTHESVQSYQVTSPVTALDVTSHVGDITITGSSSSTVSVTEQMAYSATLPVATHSVAGGTLTIGYSCPAQVICGVAFIISVPSTVSVTATTATGAIRLSGLAGSMVTAKVDAGLIDATAMSTSTASFTIDVGGITASFTAAPRTLTADARAGGIALHVPVTTQYRVTASTVAGKTSVSVPQSTASAHTITATTDVGAIQIAP